MLGSVQLVDEIHDFCGTIEHDSRSSLRGLVNSSKSEMGRIAANYEQFTRIRVCINDALQPDANIELESLIIELEHACKMTTDQFNCILARTQKSRTDLHLLGAAVYDKLLIMEMQNAITSLFAHKMMREKPCDQELWKKFERASTVRLVNVPIRRFSLFLRVIQLYIFMISVSRRKALA